ncbi:hypothetical protein A3H74_03390 [Candidatus Kaiserbacteria bacterium RIFCSPLOWO2_02_FULL_51_13]|uniref:GtrA/DPMS transmembrane domain-containing protein n=1 Tax=Candidatus Kaiserbacteria bacterium RIFCSPLOWO2_01_FULL_50_24 TaxID=1798507 RepID=A0A1F6EIV5_9BACT|nr:MAG: hypothetical protein A3A34_02770 [Candidatus Kaiserbacteria bacterium RIFCSPLOWO2_01_FULL_50_24]OGG82198.1 MAG: hypothetical protein A3H74_03390 [Candidatus Kaiserbacteria bacterium RIFCSPLOWO2_02_FULL_51_13]
MTTSYSQTFFDEMDEPNFVSARVVAPLVAGLVHPKSVVDIGCGRGLWLKAFLEQGIADVEGYDGDYVEREKLAFPKEHFHAVDLEKPITLERTFDLAVCLEVGEHLSDSISDTLVETLTASAPVVLFSAAIPLQGGSRHINEQWPEYWEKKFTTNGFVPVDALRRHIWGDSRVSFFYQQNILLYVRKDALQGYPKLVEEIHSGHGKALSLAHPQKYLYYAERWRLMVPFLSVLPPNVLHIGKRLLKNVFHMPIGQIVRYLISGCTAVAVNLAVLYALVEFVGFHYLLASAAAFSIGIMVSFSLHKFFTFRERNLSHTHIQIVLYLCVIGLGLVTNLALMWFLVELIGILYLIAAIITNGIIAVANFFAYRLVVFRRS